MQSQPEKLLKKHQKLIHSDHLKVTSHVQREQGEWFLNTLMIEGVDVPFRYKRKQRYKSLQGACVNMTYYMETEKVAGMDFAVMKVVRIRVS